VLESLALLQLSDGDLIVHTMIMNESSGKRKLKVPATVLLLILKLLRQRSKMLTSFRLNLQLDCEFLNFHTISMNTFKGTFKQEKALPLSE